MFFSQLPFDAMFRTESEPDVVYRKSSFGLCCRVAVRTRDGSWFLNTGPAVHSFAPSAVVQYVVCEFVSPAQLQEIQDVIAALTPNPIPPNPEGGSS